MDPDRTYRITRGTEYWKAGRIALAVRGSGEAEVEHRRNGEHRRYDGRIDPEDVERLDGLGLSELRPSRTDYRMDEPTVSIEVHDGEELVHRADLPVGDRETDARLERLLSLWDALVEHVTAGDLPHGPAAAPR